METSLRLKRYSNSYNRKKTKITKKKTIKQKKKNFFYLYQTLIFNTL